jgi:hypothetical protein
LRAVITSHARVTDVETGLSDQFGYCLFGNDGLLHRDTVSLRTARIFATELKGSSPFMEMMATISQTDPENFTTLVGRTFSD